MEEDSSAITRLPSLPPRKNVLGKKKDVEGHVVSGLGRWVSNLDSLVQLLHPKWSAQVKVRGGLFLPFKLEIKGKRNQEEVKESFCVTEFTT